MKMLFNYKKINLPAIVIEYISTVINAKAGRHGLPYGFWLNMVFSYFNIECGKVQADSVKQVLNISTIEENKSILKLSDKKSKSLVSDLMDEQKWLKKKREILTALLALRDVEIVVLKVAFAEGR